jgi:hypothetical protein
MRPDGGSARRLLARFRKYMDELVSRMTVPPVSG